MEAEKKTRSPPPHEPTGATRQVVGRNGIGQGVLKLMEVNMAQAIEKDSKSVLFSQNGMLHCGAEICTEEDVRKSKTPPPDGRFCPVDHMAVSDCARENLAIGGHEVIQQEHSLTHDGQRWFSLLELETNSGELSRIVGLRNSHDKSFRAQVVTGTGVFVCDNLSFTGEINVGRKHTTHILRDMPILMGKAVKAMGGVFEDSEQRVAAYKERELSREEVHDIVCLAMEQGFITSGKIKPILAEYKQPRHEEFSSRTAWSLSNAFTEIGKAWPLHTLQARSMGMNGILDAHCGLDIRPAVLDAEDLVITDDEDADLVVTIS